METIHTFFGYIHCIECSLLGRHQLAEQARELRRNRRELDARVEVLGVLAEDHEVDPLLEVQGIARGGLYWPEADIELEELAHQFNTMAINLRDLYENLETRVDQRTQELTALNSVAEVVSRTLDLERILRDALTKTIEVLDMDAGAVFRIQPDTQDLILVHQQGLSPEMTALVSGITVESSIIAEVLSTRRPAARLVKESGSGA